MIDREFEILAEQAYLSGCDKKQVVAGVWAGYGSFITSTNECAHEGDVCPRLEMPSGEGYELCAPSHAEANLVHLLGVRGTIVQIPIVWVYGHYYACEDCASKLKEIGVKEIRVREYL